MCGRRKSLSLKDLLMRYVLEDRDFADLWVSRATAVNAAQRRSPGAVFPSENTLTGRFMGQDAVYHFVPNPDAQTDTVYITFGEQGLVAAINKGGTYHVVHWRNANGQILRSIEDCKPKPAIA
jgi:hypothetical protein